MIIQFSVRNYKTFKDVATLSLVASNYDKETRVEDNIFINEKYNLRLLKSAAIYGPNASGKTKLFDALSAFRTFVQRSYERSLKEMPIPVVPFKFNSESQNEPTEFEIIFLYENILYRYGFEATKNIIVTEWLYYKPQSKETELFYREGDHIEYNKTQFSKGELIKRENALRGNVLLLTVAASLNDKISNSIVEFFKTLNIISGLEEDGYQMFTMKQISDSIEKSNILNFMKSADLGISDISLKNTQVEDLPKNLPEDLKKKLVKLIEEKGPESVISDIVTSHKKYDDDQNYVGNELLSLEDEESSGTQKFFSLSGPILDCLKNGTTLIIDELDSKLHPNLVYEIVALFNSAEKNPKNAQLIVNTHNTNLLSRRLIRRDQVWFTEKNRYGETKLYSLADFKAESVRKDEAFEDNYVRGKYGAIPYLNVFGEWDIK